MVQFTVQNKDCFFGPLLQIFLHLGRKKFFTEILAYLIWIKAISRAVEILKPWTVEALKKILETSPLTLALYT